MLISYKPKYWCKHCKTFVRDTKLEKTNHEATGKHQGNIKRFLRDLHRGHEKEEREHDRAKSEVERLNGIVAGTSSNQSSGPPWNRQSVISQPPSGREATQAERKAQLAKLAEMGVAVPEDYRREVAMAGDWQIMSEKPVDSRAKGEDFEDFKNFAPDTSLNIGVRKRKFDGQEEEEEAGETVVRKGWGSKIRHYPPSIGGNDDDLDALLNKSIKQVAAHTASSGENSATETRVGVIEAAKDSASGESPADTPTIKKEESDTGSNETTVIQDAPAPTHIKKEDTNAEPTIMFKKRKAKAKSQS